MKSVILTLFLLQAAVLSAFELSCKDCTTLQYGNDPAALTDHTCQAGTVCGPLGGAFSCIPDDSPDAASCSCSGQDTGYKAEPYEPTKYIACLPDGEQSVLECPSGVFMSESTAMPPCGTGPQCVATGTDYPAEVGFNAWLDDTEKCTKWFFCEKVPADDLTAIVPSYECPEGQVYDTTQLTCVDPCTLAPEPFECAADDSGPFADPEDCTIFHLCFNGVKIGEPIACPDGFYYKDDPDMACVEETTGADPICEVPGINACYVPYQAECKQNA